MQQDIYNLEYLRLCSVSCTMNVRTKRLLECISYMEASLFNTLPLSIIQTSEHCYENRFTSKSWWVCNFVATQDPSSTLFSLLSSQILHYFYLVPSFVCYNNLLDSYGLWVQTLLPKYWRQIYIVITIYYYISYVI